MPRRTRIWPMEAEMQAPIIAVSTRSMTPSSSSRSRRATRRWRDTLQVAECDPARAGGLQGGADAGTGQRRQLRLVIIGGHLPPELGAAPGRGMEIELGRSGGQRAGQAGHQLGVHLAAVVEPEDAAVRLEAR